MADSTKVIVIGGVACGPKVASRLKRLMPDAEITMIEKGKIVSYGACGMPYFVSGDVSGIQALMETPAGTVRNPAFFKQVKGFETLTNTEVVAIHRAEKTVDVVCHESGEQKTLSYDKLVLATGARPLVLPIPGVDLCGVSKMHHPDDAEAVMQAIATGGTTHAVIVGGGLIGLEMAESYRAQDIEVTIVEMLGYAMANLFDEEMGRLAMKHLVKNGVRLRMNETVEAFLGDSQGRLRAVKTSGGEIEADHALLAVGVRPNSELAINPSYSRSDLSTGRRAPERR
jgi:NADPH-dependent 2,4-dienoyl-CoA reductase/sulfur reductase-like enzyme